ncbi:hypothetical protein FXO37_22907 [Capsicum annuum]|nr:hypothetical protein FXO37_22907 [Capsicum annuum]
MLERSQMAQGEGRQLASEAVINHKTITAFSSQDRMLDLFEKPQAFPLPQHNVWGKNYGQKLTQFKATGSSSLPFETSDLETDIKSYNLKSLRSQIALVSKEPTLFAGSIRGNIIYGKEEATESEIKKAAICANANEFQSATKDGYETYWEALEKMMISRTVVVVHRLSTIQKTETIAVIKNGKVVEQGSYSQLLALGKSGSYYGTDEVAI